MNLTGKCDGNLTPYVLVELRGPLNHVTLNVLLDTGYSGWLKLDTTVFEHLGLATDVAERVQLADGSISEIPMGVVELMWDSHWQKGLAHFGDGGSMLGMQALKGHEVHLFVGEGGWVVVTPAAEQRVERKISL